MVGYIRAVSLGVICLSVGMMSAVSYRELHATAQQAYEQKDFQKAKNAYCSMEKKGPGAWFNVGNCHAALHEYHDAIICYHRARSKAYGTLVQQIDEALTQAYRVLGVVQQGQTFYEWFTGYMLRIPLLLLQLLFLLSWYMMWFFLYQRKNVWSVIGLFFAVSIIGAFVAVHYFESGSQKGIVIRATQLLAGPHRQYDVVQEVAPYEKIQILSVRPEWYKVASHSSVGWISAKHLALM